MTQLADVDRFITESQRVETPAELDSLVADITAEMGFDYYALIHHVDLTPMDAALTHMADGSMVALTNYPDKWVETYLKRNIVANDPILLASDRSAIGFRWEDVPKLIPVTAAHREVCEAAGRAGLVHGFTIPAHVPGEANGSCSFALRAGRTLPEANLLMAQLVGSFAFQAARSMVTRARAAAIRRVKLTPRQLECLRLVARGKTDWEIGQILGISEESVKYHVKQARERYDVPTRVQAAFRSVYDGQIALREIVG